MLHKRETFTCPCCGGYIGEAAPVAFVAERLPVGHQARVFEAFSRRVGRPFTKESLIQTMYGDRSDGGPETADNIVSIQVLRLRTFLEQYGWTITSEGRGRGNKVFYRLIPLEASL